MSAVINTYSTLAGTDYPVKASTTIEIGEAVGVNRLTGKAQPYNDEADLTFVGHAIRRAQADSSGNAVGQGQPSGITATGPTAKVSVLATNAEIKQVSITGLTSSVGKLGDPVFMTDANTYTLTRPATGGEPIGILINIENAASGLGNIALSTVYSRVAAALVRGGVHQILNLGGIRLSALSTTAVPALTVATSMPIPFKGRVRKLFVIITNAVTASGKSVSLKLKINGTFVGGTFANAQMAIGASLSRGQILEFNFTSTGGKADFSAGSTVSIVSGSANAVHTTGEAQIIVDAVQVA